MDALVDLLSRTDAVAMQRDLLRGLSEGLADRRKAPMPSGWSKLYAKLAESEDAEIRKLSLQLALKFGDPAAHQKLRDTVADPKRSAEDRRQALTALVERQDPQLPPFLLKLLDDAALRRQAVRGLAAFNHEKTAEALLSRYAQFDAATRQDAVQTLASRASWAKALIDAMASGAVPPSDVSAFTARQILSLNDAALGASLKKVWGDVRQTSEAKLKLIDKYKKLLQAKALAKADRSQGRQAFKTLCAACHKLFDDGGAVGPDLTGSDRRNIDYVLENVLDPSAAVSKDYQMTIVSTAGGRVVTGMIKSETDRAVTVQTLNEKVTVPKDEIQSRQVIPVSMMPEGLILALPEQQVVNLVAYLRGERQIPLP